MEEIEHDVSLPLKNAGHSMHPKAENARGGGGGALNSKVNSRV